MCARSNVTTFVDFDLFHCSVAFFFSLLMCRVYVVGWLAAVRRLFVFIFASLEKHIRDRRFSDFGFVHIKNTYAPASQPASQPAAIHSKAGTISTPISSSVSSEWSIADSANK